MMNFATQFKNCRKFRSGTGASDEDISHYEHTLGLSFPEDYKAFLRILGYASWFGCRIAGISSEASYDIIATRDLYLARNIPMPRYSIILDADFALKCTPSAEAGMLVPLVRAPTEEEYLSFPSFTSYVKYLVSA